MIKPVLTWLFGLILLLAVAGVPISVMIGGVWIAWHYGGWVAAIVAFFLLTLIANILSKVLIAHYRTYKALVNLHYGTDMYSEDLDKW